MYNLVFALADHPDVKLSVFGPPGPLPLHSHYDASESESNWLYQLLTQGGIAHILKQKKISRVYLITKLLFILRKAYKRNNRVHLFHVNWLQNIIPLLGTKTPLLVSVLGTDHQLLAKPYMTWLLRRIIAKRKCIIAPNAEWMLPTLNSKFGDIAEIRCIPFGIDANFFNIVRRPCDKKQRWLVILRITSDKIGALFQWGKDVFNEHNQLHLFGPQQENITLPEWVYYHGATHPETLQKEWFPIATGLITLSQHAEGRPQVILDAMAAGLPVIASDIAGHSNILQHNETGMLVKTKEQFFCAIETLTATKNNRTLGEKAKRYAIKNIGNWNDCANRYVIAYKDLLKVKT